ncbi:DUF1080 domain-containing protein [Mangrovibacterium sp.]|uniref:3-keto-disaccharide hydrolase n=1 Tax=Mangrovibacterium sp. TaxID=1961364 RepID=UPI00356AE120
MRYFKALLLTFLLLTSVNVFAQKATKLFNGKNLNGWYAFNAEHGKPTKADQLFQAQDGMIRLFGPTVGYLMSKKSYTEFEITAEFRWNIAEGFEHKSTKKNSGLMYLVPETAKDTIWPQGIQFQIKEGATGDFILLKNVTIEKNGERNDPGASVVLPKDIAAENKPGEWNQITIRVEDGKISQYLNGRLVNEGQQASVKKGRILLQYEGFPIDFKNIHILKL